MKDLLKTCLGFALFLGCVTAAGWWAGGWYMFSDAGASGSGATADPALHRPLAHTALDD